MKQTQSAIYTTESEHKLRVAGICIAEMQETIRTQQATIERLNEQRDKLSSEANRLNEYYLDNLFETRRTSSPDPNQDAEYLRVKALIAEIEESK